MVRKPRVEYDGALYHVIVRGNQRQRTFHDDQVSQVVDVSHLERAQKELGLR